MQTHTHTAEGKQRTRLFPLQCESVRRLNLPFTGAIVFCAQFVCCFIVVLCSVPSICLSSSVCLSLPNRENIIDYLSCPFGVFRSFSSVLCVCPLSLCVCVSLSLSANTQLHTLGWSSLAVWGKGEKCKVLQQLSLLYLSPVLLLLLFVGVVKKRNAKSPVN